MTTLDARPEAPPEPDMTPRMRTGMRGFYDGLRGWTALRHTPYGIAPVVILGMVLFVQTIDFEAFQLAGPEFLKRGVSLSTIVTVTQQLGFVGIAGTLYLGWLSDRRNRVRIFSIGTIVAGLGAMGTALSFRAGSIGAARVVDEIGSDAFASPLDALLADYYPPSARGRTYALINTFGAVAVLVALIGSAELISNLGLRAAFVVIGGLIAGLGLIALVLLREPVRGYFERIELGFGRAAANQEDAPTSFGEAWRTTMAVETVRRFFIGNAILRFVDLPYLLITQLFLADRYGLDIVSRALVFTPGVVSLILGGLYGGTLLDRLKKYNPRLMVQLFGFAQLFFVGGAIVYALKPPLFVLVAMLTLRNIPLGLTQTGQIAVVSQVIPANVRSQGIQMQNQLSKLPAFLAGYTIAIRLVGSYGYSAFFWYAAPIYGLAGLVLASAASFFDSDRRRALAVSGAAEEWREAQRAGSAKLLVCRDLDVGYNGVQVLFGVDFTVDEGDIIALLGTNGAGKSTLLRAISGTNEATNGAIVFDGREITHSPPNETARRGVIHVPGGRGIFPNLTVRDNLLLATSMIDDDSEARSRLADVIETFPILRQRGDAVATTLSGGEQQMLSLAQAFLCNPKLLMIDELSLGLSPAVVAQLIDVVKAIHARGTTVIVVEQSVNVALTIAQRAVFMEKGEIRFDGAAAALLARPDILRAIYVKGTTGLVDGGRTTATRSKSFGQPILEVEGLVKRFGGIAAVDDIDLVLREGEALGIIGPNGSGKTTLIELISGYQRPDRGVIRYEGVDITGLPAEERAQRRLIRRFQDARLFPSLTVFETLQVTLESTHEAKSVILAAIGAPQSRRAERRIRARADRLIDLLELGTYRDKFVKELSTGLCRIVDLACVLASEPRVLLLDEPSTGLAQAEAEGLGPLLRRVRFETGCSMIVIEHDIPLVSSVVDELVALDLGRVVVRGTPEVVLNDDRVIESYLGTSEAVIRRSGRLS